MTDEKIQLVRRAIKRQLESVHFVSTDDDIKIPLTFRLSNNPPEGAFNVFEVDSKEEAQKIVYEITKSINIIDKTKNDRNTIYLEVVVSFK